MIDRRLVRERLLLMNYYLENLQRLSHLPYETFLGDSFKVAAAESFLRRSLEAIFDIGRHILAKSGHVDLAAEYKSIARGMKSLGVVDENLGDTLVRMAGYRNRLVHLYARIGDEELYGIISCHLGDIRAFVPQVRDFLEHQDPD